MGSPTAAQYLTQFVNNQLRPGENDQTFKFEGPGTVVIAMELPAKANGDRPIKLLKLLDAKNNALVVAKTSLASRQPTEHGDYIFALMGVIPPQYKADALEKLEAACTKDRAWVVARK